MDYIFKNKEKKIKLYFENKKEETEWLKLFKQTFKEEKAA